MLGDIKVDEDHRPAGRVECNLTSGKQFAQDTDRRAETDHCRTRDFLSSHYG